MCTYSHKLSVLYELWHIYVHLTTVITMDYLKTRNWWGIKVECIQDTIILNIPVNINNMCYKLQRRTLAEIIHVIHAAQHRNLSDNSLIILRGLENIQLSKDIDDVLRILIKVLLRTLKATNCVLVAMVEGVCSDVGFIITILCDCVYSSHNSIFYSKANNLMALDFKDYLPTLLLKLGYSWTVNLLILERSITALQAHQLGFVVQLFNFKDFMKSSIWSKMKEQSLLQIHRIKLLKKFTRQIETTTFSESLEKNLNSYHSLRDLPGFQIKCGLGHNECEKQCIHGEIWKSKI